MTLCTAQNKIDNLKFECKKKEYEELIKAVTVKMRNSN